MKKIYILWLSVLLIILSGCSAKTDNSASNSSNNSSTVEPITTDISFTKTDAEVFSDRDLDASYNEKTAIKIKLNGNSAAASDKSVNISGSTVTVTKEATYIVEGSLNNGSLVVSAPETAKIQLVLKGAKIVNSSSAPLFIKTADKVFITLAKSTQNTLTADSFSKPAEAGIDGAIYSKCDITLNGEGMLSVSSVTGHGIVSKDDLAIIGGEYNITSASHAVNANDSIAVKDMNATVKSGKDGFHSENTEDTNKGYIYINGGTFNITAEGDGISASSTLQYALANIDIVAGGGAENSAKDHSDSFGHFGGGPGGMKPGRREEITPTATTTDSSTSMKGIKSGGSMLIDSGSISINSADDSIHTNTSLYIKDGVYRISSGDDAFHADQNLEISGGSINIFNCYEGLEAHNVAVKGGNIILTATDDGINAAGGNDSSGTTGGRDGMYGKPGPGGMGGTSNGSVIISGGKLQITSSGDGIDANGTLSITGGHTTIVGPTVGDTATLDYDVSGSIEGGTFIGTGSGNMAQSITSNTQGVIALSVGNNEANTKIILKTTDGKEILSTTPELSFQVIILSSPNIKAGEKYQLTIGNNTNKVEAE